MSNAIGPVHVKERSSIEMQSRIDAEVLLIDLMLTYDGSTIFSFVISFEM